VSLNAVPLNRVADRRERGSTLVIVAMAMVVLLVMTAFAVDIGAAYNVRRQSQSAVDAGVLAGGMELQDGVAAYAEQAAAVVRTNLDATYTDLEWRSAWAGCEDPDHKPLPGTVLGTSTECISADVLGEMRVRVPDQLVSTSFAAVIGIDEIAVDAFAEAGLQVPGTGGVLPFAVLSSAGSGGLICLRSGTGGQASPPCDGAQSGNFGALESPQYGNPAMGTEALPCNLPKTEQLAVNISVGIDHYIRQHEGEDVLDSCSKPFGPTMINTFQGISGGLWEGVVAGAEVSGQDFPGRLTLGEGPFRRLRHESTNYEVDDRPLWELIPFGSSSSTTDVPSACFRETFEALAAVQRSDQLATCLQQYTATGASDPLFDLDADGDDEPDIFSTPRFGIVPQFQEASFPSGNGYLRIDGFRAIYFQGLYFGCSGGNTCSTTYQPGEGTSTISVPNGSSPLDQITGYLLPMASIDQEILEGQVAGMGPYELSLTR
jgi:hypothetical protein